MLLNCLRLIVRAFFREIMVDGQENLPQSGPEILTPNHPNSLLDPFILLTLPRRYRIRFVAEAALFKLPPLGWLMRRIGAIPVVRRMDAEGKVDSEWLSDGGWGISVPFKRIKRFQSDLMTSRLYLLRRRIQDQVDALAGPLNAGAGE